MPLVPAREIGLQRRWAQLPPKHWPPHYDLNARRRAEAVKCGAVELTRGDLLEHLKRLRFVYPRGVDLPARMGSVS